MHSLDDIIWRNASYTGIVEYTVKVSRPTLGLRDVTDADVVKVATAIREALEAQGFTARVEHHRYPG